MRPSSGIERSPESWWEDWPTLMMVAGIGLLGAAGGAAIAMMILRRRSRTPPQRYSAHARALQELARLEAARLAQSGRFEAYHTELSAIVRRYLEQRFHLAATKQTTPEFLQAMRSAACLNPDQQALLRNFLEQCDLVKFGGVTPSAEQSSALATAAWRFIQQTAQE